MPSKTSKTRNIRPQWKAASDYSKADFSAEFSETTLTPFAIEWAKEIRLGDRIILEGPMGVGKSTFARALLNALGVHQPPEGSPSFAIAHEYDGLLGGIVHIDFYRLKSEDEIDDTGIPSYYWERNLIVISEWLASWPDFKDRVIKSGRTWLVNLEFNSVNSDLRRITISKRSLR